MKKTLSMQVIKQFPEYAAMLNQWQRAVVAFGVDVDRRLIGKGNSNSHGARPVYSIHLDSDQ